MCGSISDLFCLTPKILKRRLLVAQRRESPMSNSDGGELHCYHPMPLNRKLAPKVRAPSKIPRTEAIPSCVLKTVFWQH